MGITNSNKQISAERIDCEGTLKVTLAISAAPDITDHPADIILVLDRSGSMRGTPLANLQAGANTFIDILDRSTDSAQDGQIGSGSRIGIVSFSDSALISQPFTTSVKELHAAVDGLFAQGATNHAEAFTVAAQMFDPASSNEKILVLFTDGKTTAGGPPAPAAAAARDMGIVIYCIGLIGADGIDVESLNQWATDPDASHVAVTPDETELEQLFADLAANISKPGATDIVIDELVTSDFLITNVFPPTKGTASLVNAAGIRWKIPQLGTKEDEGATLEFHIQHVGQTAGTKPVNQSVTYSDAQGNTVIFPDPVVTVQCGIVVNPEPCPAPVELEIGSCQDSVLADLGNVYLESQGRIIQLNVTVKNVCPGKRVALGIILTETSDKGKEQQRGMKTITIPAHHCSGCRDVLVKCIQFVLPEDLCPCGQSPQSLCGSRKLKVRLIAHNIDTDYRCCETTVCL